MQVLPVLQRYFGYTSFRPGQAEIVASILAGHDTLALLPTGGGKSLCYQVPGLVLGGTTIVISPLIALMKDQVEALQQLQIAATFINSSLTTQESRLRFQLLAAGQYRFVYVSPERLQTPEFIAATQTCRPKLIAVDEAHCISEWGHDFRPEYRGITKFIAQLPHRPVVGAFTATATPQVQQDIITTLVLRRPKVFCQSFSRSNLFLAVQPCPSLGWKEFYLTYLVKRLISLSPPHPAGIIYTATRDSTEHISQLLSHFWPQLSINYYHGGCSPEHRDQVQTQFLANKLQIMVATNAFGMGINKPNIRWVVHYHLPATLENYYQEAGRAGRDGNSSQCWCLYYPPDLQLQQTLISNHQNTTMHQYNLSRLNQVKCYAQTHTCRMATILEYFGESTAPSKCHNCDACLNQPLQPLPVERQFHQSLYAWLAHTAQQHHLSPQLVASDLTLHWLSLLRPETTQELTKIPGIGTGWVKQWGSDYFS